MLRHIVMWQFKDEAEGKTKAENCLFIKKQLEALPAKIPFLRKLEVGITVYSTAMSADMVLITEFDSKENLDAYAVHPDHMKVKEYISKVRTSRMVADYTF